MKKGLRLTMVTLRGSVLAFVLLFGSAVSVYASNVDGGISVASAPPDPSPSFSNPTNITNPYLPVSAIGKMVYMGIAGGATVRTEATLLNGTDTVTWDGQNTQVLVVRYVSYSNDQLVRVIDDHLGQADDGSIYRFGKDISQYKEGRFVSHDGSWIVGQNATAPALVMPGNPQVGQDFYPDNVPGVTYEAAEVAGVTEETTTPGGPISNGLLVKVVRMDGVGEFRMYAPGIGLVHEWTNNEKVDLVWFGRIGSASAVVPSPLMTMQEKVKEIMDAAPESDWASVANDITAISKAWRAYQKGFAKQTPLIFLNTLAAAFDRLKTAASAQDLTATMRASNELTAALADLFNIYNPSLPIDISRLDSLERRVLLDADSQNFVGAANALATLKLIWEHFEDSVRARDGADVAAQFDASLSTQTDDLSRQDASALTVDAQNALESIKAMKRLY